MIPNYLLVARIDLLNTYTGLIIPQVVTGYGIFMLLQTFTNLPGRTRGTNISGLSSSRATG